MISLSLGLVPSGGIVGASNRMSYRRYGAPALEQAAASTAESARTIPQRALLRASIPCGYRARQVCSPRGRLIMADSDDRLAAGSAERTGPLPLPVGERQRRTRTAAA